MEVKKESIKTENGEEFVVLDFDDIFLVVDEEMVNHEATKEIIEKIQNLKEQNYNTLPQCDSYHPEIQGVNYYVNFGESKIAKAEKYAIENDPNVDDINPLGYGIEDWRTEARVGPFEIYICHPSYYVSNYTVPVLESVVEICKRNGLV